MHTHINQMVYTLSFRVHSDFNLTGLETLILDLLKGIFDGLS